MKKLSVLSLALGCGLAVFATDGTWIKNGAYTNAATWEGGIIPDGAGATLWVGGTSGGQANTLKEITSTRTNATLGHIDWVADNTKAATFGLNGLRQAELVQDGASLPHYAGYSVLTPDYGLTLDSGSEKEYATIGLTRDRASTPATQRFWLDAPLCLKSPLRLQHTGRVNSKGANCWIGGNSSEGCYASVVINSDISDGGRGLGLDIKIDTYDYVYSGSSLAKVYNAAMLTGRNTFTGDVTVTEGLLRVDSRDGRYAEVSTALGVNNSVYVTNNLAALELSGVKTGRGQHLYLGSTPLPTYGTTATLGALSNMRGDPMLTGEWMGAVTLLADTPVGGTINYGIRSKVGALAISGPIDGAHDLIKIGKGHLTLSGENTFTGNLVLKAGYTRLTKVAAAGAGQVVFAGGGYRVTSADDADISACDLAVGQAALQLYVDGDFTYNPANGFTNQMGLMKMGQGVLLLNKPCSWLGSTNKGFLVEDGELILDYMNLKSDEYIFPMNAPTSDGTTLSQSGSYFYLANDAKMTVRVPSGRQLNMQSNAARWNAFATIRKEGPGSLYVARMANNFQNTSIVMLDAAEGKIMTYDVNGTNSPDLPEILNPRLLWKNESFAYRAASDGTIGKFTDFATDWQADCTNRILSVTDENVADMPAHFTVGALYFNTPAADKEIVLNLTGTNVIMSGIIFVGPDMDDTVIRFTGGALTMKPTSASPGIRIYNFNTNAAARLDIASELSGDKYDIAADGTATLAATNNAAVLIVAGGGETRFTGKNTVRGPVHVLGGNLLVNNADFLQYEADSVYWIAKEIYLTAGGSFGFLKSGLFTQYHPDYRRGVYPDDPTMTKTEKRSFWSDTRIHVLRPSGTITVPDEETLVGLTNCNSKVFYWHGGATLVKKGAGTLEFDQAGAGLADNAITTTGISPDPTFKWDVQEGTLQLPDTSSANPSAGFAAFGEQPSVIRLRPGVKLRGRGFLHANLAYGTGHVTAIDVGGPIRYSIDPNGDDPVVFDCARKSAYNGFGGLDFSGYLGPRASGLFSGSGDIRIIDSDGGDCLNFGTGGFVCEEYAGTMFFEVNVKGYWGLMLPNAGVSFKALETYTSNPWHHTMTGLAAPSFAFEVGRLLGDGSVEFHGEDGDGVNFEHCADSGIYVGCDDGSTNVFTGKLYFGRTNVRNIEFVKTGNSVQELACETKYIWSPFYLTEGTLRIGADCTTETSPIPTPNAKVYIGCGAQVPAGLNPRLVTSGGYTIEAPITAWTEGAADPEVGSDATGGTTVFKTGAFSISNRLAFVAAGASTVIVSNDLTGAGVLAKRGTGTVILAGTHESTLLLGNLEAGGLSVNGDVTVAEGSVLDLRGLDFGDSKVRYEILRATGTVTGFENYTILGLPDGWLLRPRRGRYVLYRPAGAAVFLQ